MYNSRIEFNDKVSKSIKSYSTNNKKYYRKIWVYFKSKGPNRRNNEIKLEKEVLKRRSKVRKSGELTDDRDLNIYEPFYQNVLNVLKNSKYKSVESRIHIKSNWLNAISVWNVTKTEVNRISKLDCVRKIDIVRGYKKKLNKEYYEENENSRRKSENEEKISSHVLHYGGSATQQNQVASPFLHDRGIFGQGVKMLVLDAGFHLSHHTFKNISILGKWNFVHNNSNVDLEWNHGSKVLSIIGGEDPGNFYGIAHKTQFLLGKTEDLQHESPLEEDNFFAAVEWGEKRGVDVLTSSLGYTDWFKYDDYDGQTPVISQAVNFAVENGIAVVISAGNEGTSGVSAPTDAYFVISVGAVDSSGSIAGFSSRGPTYDNRIKPEVCALGRGTRVASHTNDITYATGDGTSFAAPVVAGCVSLLLSEHPDWSPHYVRKALMDTASRSNNPDNNYGYGIVNTQLASQYVGKKCEVNCKKPEDGENSYLFNHCYSLDNQNCDEGKWVCLKYDNHVIRIGKNCSSNEKYVCSKENCAYICVDNVCKQKDMDNYGWVFIVFLIRLITNTFW